MMKLALLFLFTGMVNGVVAQNTDHSVSRDESKNQVMLQLDWDVPTYKYYNTDDLESIDINGQDVIVKHKDGDDVYTNRVTDISFFKAVKPVAPTKADLIGKWELRAQEEESEESFSYTFTENELIIEEFGTPLVCDYSFNDGILTYTTPATEWSEPETFSKQVLLLYDKTVLVLKNKAFGEDNELEQAETFFKAGKEPNTSDANLDGKWFCYHGESKDEVRLGFWFNGNNFDCVIGAWSARMTGTYTYEKGILYLHPTEFYTGRESGEWGYGRVDPATLECSSWKQVEAFDFPVQPVPKTFVFIVNGDEIYGWYANLPCLYYRQ